MDSLVKAPEDQFNFFIYFDHDLAAAETITGYDVYSGNRETGLASTDLLIAATLQTEQKIEVMLLAGQAMGEQHKITAVVYTDQGNIHEKDVVIDVLDVDIDHFYKQSSEEFKISVDFGPLLGEAETLVAGSIVIIALLGADLSNRTAVNTGATGVDVETSQKVELKVKGGSHEDFIMIGVQVDCTDQVLGTTKRLRRIVNMSIRDDGYFGTLTWDAVTSDASVAAGGTGVVAVIGSCGPFTWEVAGTGFSLTESTTSFPVNQLIASSNACGDATVTVSNACGVTELGVVTGPVNAIAWDDANSDDTVLRNGSAVVAITATCGPFTWSVTGTGFSLENATTSGLVNQLNADATACGAAMITVTNAQGAVAAGYVREPNYGSWVLILSSPGDVASVAIANGVIGAYDTMVDGGTYRVTTKTVGKYKLQETINGLFYFDYWCGFDTRPQASGDYQQFLIPYSLQCSDYDKGGSCFGGTGGCDKCCGVNPSVQLMYADHALYEWVC